MNAIINCIAAFAATVAFSVLFHVPKKYYPACGLTGALGFLCYYCVQPYTSKAVACFFATLLIVLFSRFCAVRLKCPVTLFLISGIIPLVPGTGIYWTAYYTIAGEPLLASANGMESLSISVAIVLGIVFVFELPQKVFLPHMKKEKSK